MKIDPRLLICGCDDELGLFDAGSWDEILQPWAQTVVVGRARLGGIPLGVIAVGKDIHYSVIAVGEDIV